MSNICSAERYWVRHTSALVGMWMFEVLGQSLGLRRVFNFQLVLVENGYFFWLFFEALL